MVKYCLDTNVYLEAWNGYYSNEIVPMYWNKLLELAEKGIVFSTIEVADEITKKDDLVSERIKENKKKLFRKIEQDENVQECLIKILDEFPNLIDATKWRSLADPWVIAHAMATWSTVVTKEHFWTQEKPKIPYVCKHYGIKCINDFEFIKEVWIIFTL